MKTLLIGNGYWGNIVKSKLELLTTLVCVADSKSNIDDILINNEIDYVFICSSIESHYEIVKKCINYKKNIFCEKPFTGNLQNSIELYDLASLNNVNIFVDNLFLYRNEFLNIKTKPFKNIQFIWNKKDPLCKENLLDNLMYHDVYLLIEMTNNNWNVLDCDINNSFLNIKMINNNISANFSYNRNFDKKEKLIIIDDSIIDLSHPTNDPLLEIITKIIDKDIDYVYNKNITLETLKILQNIKNIQS
jgi:hypothetical protein